MPTRRPTSIKPTTTPTFKPTRVSVTPTESPTAAPTSSPTVVNGWLYREQYDVLDADEGLVYISGVATNECWTVYSNNGEPWASARYSCDEGMACFFCCKSTNVFNLCIPEGALLEVFWNRGCKQNNMLFNHTYELGLTNDHATNTSSVLLCNNNGSAVPPIPIDTVFAVNS